MKEMVRLVLMLPAVAALVPSYDPSLCLNQTACAAARESGSRRPPRRRRGSQRRRGRCAQFVVTTTTRDDDRIRRTLAGDAADVYASPGDAADGATSVAQVRRLRDADLLRLGERRVRDRLFRVFEDRTRRPRRLRPDAAMHVLRDAAAAREPDARLRGLRRDRAAAGGYDVRPQGAGLRPGRLPEAIGLRILSGARLLPSAPARRRRRRGDAAPQ